MNLPLVRLVTINIMTSEAFSLISLSLNGVLALGSIQGNRLSKVPLDAGQTKRSISKFFFFPNDATGVNVSFQKNHEKKGCERQGKIRFAWPSSRLPAFHGAPTKEYGFVNVSTYLKRSS